MQVPTTIRPTALLRTLLIVVAVGCAGFGIFEIGHGLWRILSDEADPGIGELVGGAGLLLAAFLEVRLAGVRLDLSETEIRIVNTLRSESIPWSKVRRFEVDGKYVLVESMDGRHTPVHTIQKNGHRTRVHVAADLNEFLEQRRPSMGLPA